jgi:hypothetical protein
MKMKLAITYSILALIATAVNIGVQDVVIRSYMGAYDILISILAGTAAGLVVKYLLDKRYIFRYNTRSFVHEGKTFVLYTLTGLVTTFIFWGLEFYFHYQFQTKSMRYVGGIMGLAIGYMAKYNLDKRFVFRKEDI